MTIYHIVLPGVWEQFKEKDFYEAESLHTEGFIHCSFAEQINGVLERYYQGIEKVLILTIDSEKLSSELVNEPSTNDEIYPHIYGQINREAIVGIENRALID
jgi:uncharacterized protein (DUF952 family)